MTQPTANWQLVRVTGSYTTLKAAPVTGTVDFTYKATTKDHNAKKVIFPDVFTATLTSGSFSIVLPASDDTDIDGSPFTVTVTERLTANGAPVGRAAFDVELSLSNPVSGTPSYPTVDIADLGKATPAPLVASYVTRPEMNAAIAAGGGGGGGGVTSVDARTGVVVLTDRYDAINAATTAVSGHVGASDPHGDRANAATLYIPLTQKAANSGVASLDSGGKVPSGQIPAGLPYDASGAANSAVAAHVAATDPHGDRANAGTLYVPLSQRGANNGVATLGSTGLVPPAQIGSAPVLVLNIGDTVPGGTPAGTVIVRH